MTDAPPTDITLQMRDPMIKPSLEALSPAAVLSQSIILPCGAMLPNRLAKAAMSEQLGDATQAPTEGLVRLFGRLAAGGAGLLITGNVMIDRSALGEPGNVVVEDDRDLPLLQRWAAAATAVGVPIWPQLNHPGRQSPAFLSPEPVAPSAVQLTLGRGAFARPRALTVAEIEALIIRFATTASVLKRAGFTGVQLHGAHGYLISQFLSPLVNQRTDDWGGTPEKRLRFLLAIVAAVRAAVGRDFPIGVKLNSADFQKGGFEEAESMAVIEALETAGIDLLEISGGSYESPVFMTAVQASTRRREAYFLEYAERVRAKTRLPLMVTGGFRSAAAMSDAVRTGAADIVGLARPLALEPDLPRRLLQGESVASLVEPRRTGLRQLDSLAEILWYNHQLQRMGAGREPDPNLGPWRSIVVGLLVNCRNGLRRLPIFRQWARGWPWRNLSDR